MVSLSANHMKRHIFIIHGSHHLTDHAFNGDGLVAWGFVNELARRGHRLHVLTDRLDVAAPVPPNCTLVEFPRRYRNSILHYIAYSLRARRYYDRIVRAEGVDVVHQLNPVVRGVSLALLRRNVPIVLGTYVGDWNTHKWPIFPRKTLRARLRDTMKAAIDALQQHFASRLVLATPHALKRVALGLDVGDRVEFLHHGVDIELYSPDRQLTDPQRLANSIIFVGAVRINKGIATLVEAFARVVERVASATLVIVGDGKELESTKAGLTALGIVDRVRFTGRLNRAEVAGWLRACDVLCAPSYGEPYGQNVIEAMATGLPVVITTEGGHRYIGDPGGTFSAAPGDADAFADALTTILLDPARARTMGMHNRRIAEERHAWPKVVDGLELIYERSIASSKWKR